VAARSAVTRRDPRERLDADLAARVPRRFLEAHHRARIVSHAFEQASERQALPAVAAGGRSLLHEDEHSRGDRRERDQVHAIVLEDRLERPRVA
jgi:hypothetical protein